MPLPNHHFERDEVYPSYFVNRLQDYLAGATTEFNVVATDTAVQVSAVYANFQGSAITPIVAINIQGRWRFQVHDDLDPYVVVSRSHPGGAAGTYTVWAVAKDEVVSDSPDPYTDQTDYSFDLRVTAEDPPDDEDVEIYRAVAYVDWDGSAITEIRQFAGWVGPGRLNNLWEGDSPDVVATRQTGGGYLLELADAVVGPEHLSPSLIKHVALTLPHSSIPALGSNTSAHQWDEPFPDQHYVVYASGPLSGLVFNAYPQAGGGYTAAEQFYVQMYNLSGGAVDPGGKVLDVVGVAYPA